MPEIIQKPTNDPTINLGLDTLKKKKQALVFTNTKASAEKTAEEIAKCIKGVCLIDLKEAVLKVLSRPTKQCERLSKILKRGIAFHHAGLTHKQKEIIEDNFRNSMIKIICCTPTLAFGLDLPAFRAIIGFVLETFLAISINLFPSSIPSRYKAIAFVSSSFSKYSRKS